jgi:hypothetical protein
MKFSRRGLFPLTAAGIVGAASQTHGSELDKDGYVALKLYHSAGWHVLVPRFDGFWKPGMIPYLEHMPLADYLAAIERGMKNGEV